MIAFPPVAGAVHETVSWLTAVAAEITDTAFGTVVTVIADDADDAGEVPEALVALTVNV